ncbi:Bug family tripartite tricarboxylate transporter substrate binding protein [Parapusillimonas granuli]|uniref:Tripartite tricarboxylate transporter substrate binding protein n=1 Tax=Parapusillimonas granuli TaxID=380911 RepID=A0A853G5Q0_9BURK|nr:tripartite tricarboxylate transporter substrate-binding protein [Parapusillimonas granuli]MBB5215416.1 tripartite-type tricarboxylate transporter receptor subunit TctC [Parapusillimonas granuli]MEB2400254.1 tripartite tricarboxylate transporter substrate-binding protein [Alcaligenaceae bacterium]NYT49916.1 tripartite tricarboxylate transporter substrate binding protein [Parapusillimonas granuli]
MSILKNTVVIKSILALALGFAATAAAAASTPTTIVVAFPAGGPADTLARVVAKELEARLQSPVVVENKPGGNGAIAASYVGRAAPDGNTLFLSSAGAIAINPPLYPKLVYNPKKELQPITMLVSTPEVLVVPADGKVNDLKQFLDNAAKKPGSATLSSSGIGSMPHMAISLLKAATKAEILHVPYRGAAPAINDTVGGQVGGFFGDISGLMPFIKDKRVLPIAIAAPKRSALLPEVPTFDELGYRNVYANNWYGMFAPMGTPADKVQALNKALREVMDSEPLRKYVGSTGIEATPTSPEEFAAIIDADTRKWAEVIKSEGITVNE